MAKHYRIAIAGGSIAGCSAAIALQRAGHQVTVYERSAQPLQDRGAGIVVPTPLFEKLQAMDWLDTDMPHIPLNGMDYRLRKPGHEAFGAPLWQRPLEGIALRWGQLFQQLRQRVDDASYQRGVEVISHSSDASGAINVQLSSGEEQQADLLIYADGLHSRGRALLNNNAAPQYSDYILWRGVIPETAAMAEVLQADGVNWQPFNGGMAGSYFIPSETGDCQAMTRSLNWGIYQRITLEEIAQLLELSTPELASNPHQLSNVAKQYLQTLLKRQLPSKIADILCQTEQPFVQAIVDVSANTLCNEQLALIGDAAAVLRPHAASGAVKAIDNALCLQVALEQHDNLATALSLWQEQELPKLQQQTALSTALGNGLITDAPPWEKMTSEDMGNWWTSLLEGKDWYLK
ncbi:MAG: FAD binding domain-containing protein [Spongiibacteraceae bacterium]